MDYVAKFHAVRDKDKKDFVLTVKVPAALCPCSKNISKYGAHNQRGEVTVRWDSKYSMDQEDLIHVHIKFGKLRTLLAFKRADEKFVTRLHMRTRFCRGPCQECCDEA